MKKICLLAVLAAGFFFSVSVNAQTNMESALENFTVHRDVVYAVPNGLEQKMNLFVPKNGTGPFPLIVWIHGGGWRNGNYDDCPPLQFWNRTDYAYASIGYRLSGTAPFPAHIEDCKSAIRWLRANAAEYKLDPEHIGVWGASAGGHLAAMLGVTGDVKEFDVGEHLEVSSRVQAACDLCGPVDLLAWGKTTDFEAKAQKDFIGGLPLEVPENLVRASPLAYVRRDVDFPPFLILHGESDVVVPPAQAQLFYDALIRVKADAELILVPGAGHAGRAYFRGETGGKVQAFFDRYLLPGALSGK